MQQMVVRRGELSGVLVAGTYRSTDLLLEAIIELYPDLLLGRRGVTMRNEEGRWRKGRQWLMQCSNQNLFFFYWLNYIFLYLTSASHSFLLMVILVMHCCWWHFCVCYYSIVCINCCTTLMTERDQQQQKEWHENIHRNVLTDEHFYLQWNKLWNVQV